MKVSKYIDHTCLKQDATKEMIKKLCDEAVENDFMSVCVNGSFVEYAVSLLKGSDVKVCAVIGFPLGQMTKESKVFECEDLIQKGANEIDMVINDSKLKEKDFEYVIDEIQAVKKACKGNVLKVIIETCLLTKEEIVDACNCILKTDADFVKTSTGFSKGGATIEDVELIKSIVKDKKLIKAAGGIKDKETFTKMILAGANRIGTSNGVNLI